MNSSYLYLVIYCKIINAFCLLFSSLGKLNVCVFCNKIASIREKYIALFNAYIRLGFNRYREAFGLCFEKFTVELKFRHSPDVRLHLICDYKYFLVTG